MASPAFPEPPPSIPASTLADCDALLAAMLPRAQAWIDTDLPTRIDLIKQCMAGVVAVQDAWIDSACKAKGLAADDPRAGEEWLGGPMTTLRNLRLLVRALEAGGQPKIPKTWTRPDGQHVAQVFPTDKFDGMLFTGFCGEVWGEPGQDLTQGELYRDKARGVRPMGGVSLVLGAGNVASIGPTDVLHKMMLEDEIVILKLNPVNEYLGPHLEIAFACLIEAGFLGLVYGGAEVGAHLCQHPDICSIHITGSNHTHDAIVWGSSPEEQARRKAAGEPVLAKPISSELGCVTPVLVVPGPWSDADIEFQARQVVGMVGNNGSFNCNAAKILLLPQDWDRRDAFLAAVHRHLSAAPPRKAYYPGAQDRYQRFLDNYPSAEPLGERSDEVVPWTLLHGVGAKAGEYALSNEAFCGVLAVVDLEGGDAESYLPGAVRFANEACWGNLSCMLFVHPKTEKAHPVLVDQAIADLRYGGVGVNCWAGLVYGAMSLTWGAFPGNPLSDIKSGRGVVHNTYMIDQPQKSVMRAPFRISPTPAWFNDHKTVHLLGRKLAAFEAEPSLLKLPGLIFTAIRG